MDTVNYDECGFHAFRVNWPHYTKSIFQNRTEIVTDGSGTITGVTNPEKLLWAKIPPSDGEIQILEVGKGAFSSCTKLRQITFSSNLEVISEEAFLNSAMLSSVSLPDSVYEIGKGAFEKTALRCFVVPRQVDSVSSRCFMDDRNLESVVLHEDMKRIGILAFAGCSNLRSLDLPQGIEEVEEGCFMSSGLRSLYLPRSIRTIGEGALQSCSFLEKIFYDGRDEDFRKIRFGRNWNRRLNPACTLFIRDSRGYWYDAFSSEGKAVHETDEIREALSLFGLETVPGESELTSLFRKKAMAFHPDRLSGLNLDSEYTRFAEEQFRRYKSAYDLIRPYCRKNS